MKDENTICFKVSRSIELLERAIKTQELDVAGLSEYLHHIRSDAQRMENGLKWRKEIMVREGLENEYQERKKKELKLTGVNEIANEAEEIVKDNPEFEFTVKKNGKLLYENRSHAGVVCTVEKIEGMDEFGQMTGTTQKLIFGNPAMIWFAFDQLKISIEAKSTEILAELRHMIEGKKFLNPEVRKEYIEATNKMLRKGNNK
jgi:hypothetical protein